LERTPAFGDGLPVGTRGVQFVAMDQAGNSHSCIVTVTVTSSDSANLDKEKFELVGSISNELANNGSISAEKTDELTNKLANLATQLSADDTAGIALVANSMASLGSSSAELSPAAQTSLVDAAQVLTALLQQQLASVVLDVCGNGECKSTESCGSCPEDCGACVFFHPASVGPLSITWSNTARWQVGPTGFGPELATVTLTGTHTAVADHHIYLLNKKDVLANPALPDPSLTTAVSGHTFIGFYLRYTVTAMVRGAPAGIRREKRRRRRRKKNTQAGGKIRPVSNLL
jgi:hypothetical protein